MVASSHPPPGSPLAPGGRFAENIMHFGRLLRAAGLPVGPSKVLDAVDAAACVGVIERADLRAALAAIFVERREQMALFEEAFELFFRDPRLTERAMQALLPKARGRIDHKEALPSRRLAEALAAPASPSPATPGEQIELDAAHTLSAREVLQARDFEQMSAAELEEAKRMLARLRLPLPRIVTRRHAADARGTRLDLRRTLRTLLRQGGEAPIPRWRSRLTRTPRLVVLCDVSGSMARYSRMFLHFLHALASGRERVASFTFGTRLTDITRDLARRDIDAALDAVGRAVPDWSGGTRIGECLYEFNRRWARRLLAPGAVVLIITDGLDCGEPQRLATEMQRLSRSALAVLWLNPLLRFAGFEAKPAGIRAMLPHVDRFMAAHNIASLTELGQVLSGLRPSAMRPVARGDARAGRGGMAAFLG